MSRRHRHHYELPEVDMTPLIDCVFQLVIFFILIMSVDQVFGISIKFTVVSSGGQAAGVKKKEQQLKPIQVWVGPDNYTEGHRLLSEGYLKVNGEPVALGVDKDSAKAVLQHEKGMDYLYKRLLYFTHNKELKYDTSLTVSGEVNTYHGKIVEVVDQAKKAGLKGFSLVPSLGR